MLAGDFHKLAWLYKLFASKKLTHTVNVWTYEYNLHSYIWIVLCERLHRWTAKPWAKKRIVLHYLYKSESPAFLLR